MGEHDHGSLVGMYGAFSHLPDNGPASDPLGAAILRLEDWWIENGPRIAGGQG